VENTRLISEHHYVSEQNGTLAGIIISEKQNYSVCVCVQQSFKCNWYRHMKWLKAKWMYKIKVLRPQPQSAGVQKQALAYSKISHSGLLFVCMLTIT
jgi:hypothetical protein